MKKKITIIALLLCISIACETRIYAQADSIPPEALFNQGQAYSKANDWQNALAVYDQLLAQNWNTQLVYLEKAFVLEHLDRPRDAEFLYRQVLANNPPEAVRNNIQLRLNNLPSVSPTENNSPLAFFDGINRSVSTTFGYFYDSNVNAGPSDDTLFIFNLPFVLSDDATRQSAHGYQFRLNYGDSKRLNLGRSVHTSIGYNRVDYSGIDQFDLDSLSGRLEWMTPLGAGNLGIPVVYQSIFLDSNLYSQSISSGPVYRLPINDRLSSITSLFYTYRMNDQVDQRTGSAVSVDQKFRWTSNQGKQFFELNVSHGYEFAQVDFLSSQQTRAGLGLFTHLPYGFHLYVAPAFQYVKYNSADPFFGEVRKEPEFSINTNLGHPIGIFGLDCALGYTFTESFANLDLYEFLRHQASVTFHRHF